VEMASHHLMMMTAVMMMVIVMYISYSSYIYWVLRIATLSGGQWHCLIIVG